MRVRVIIADAKWKHIVYPETADRVDIRMGPTIDPRSKKVL